MLQDVGTSLSFTHMLICPSSCNQTCLQTLLNGPGAGWGVIPAGETQSSDEVNSNWGQQLALEQWAHLEEKSPWGLWRGFIC